MKRKDIEVGKRYAFGRRSWRDVEGFGTVAEVGVAYEAYSGRHGFHKTKKADGVRLVDVKWEAGCRSNVDTIVPARDIDQPEESYRAEQARAKQVARERDEQRRAADDFRGLAASALRSALDQPHIKDDMGKITMGPATALALANVLAEFPEAVLRFKAEMQRIMLEEKPRS